MVCYLKIKINYEAYFIKIKLSKTIIYDKFINQVCQNVGAL